MTAVQSTPAPAPATLSYEREEMIFEEDYVDVGELSGMSRHVYHWTPII